MGLDRETEQRLRELFGGQRCCQCARPAARLADDRFYCDRHFLNRRRRTGGEGGRDRRPRASA